MSNLPFHGLKYTKYLILNVMMFVERQEVLEFMFAVNKKTRTFITQNIIIIQNGFINEGLIPYIFEKKSKNFFNQFYYFEKLYFETIARNVGNRKLTI